MNAVSYVQSLKRKTNGRIILHIIFWIFFCLSVFYLQSISFSPYRGYSVFLITLKQVFTTIIVFYPLVYWIWPKLWQRKKYILFSLSVILLIVIYTTADFQLEHFIFGFCKECLEKIKQDPNGYYSLLQRGAINVILLRLITLGIVYQLFVFLALPLTVKIIMEFLDQRVSSLELQQQNTRLELNFLKAQVNPHFLFNTLNNIYGLILNDKKEQSAEMVARLSSFLRYSLYDTEEHENNIGKEIKLLKDYISLEQIRLNDVVVNFNRSIDDEQAQFPPLLLMPAVENAFKFCAAPPMGDPYIFINMTLANPVFEFRISNTFVANEAGEKEKGGIGIENLKKRLQRYYPDEKHTLDITAEDGVFMLILKIQMV